MAPGRALADPRTTFVLRAAAWSLGLFALLRLSWIEQHLLLALIDAQSAIVRRYFHAEASSITVTSSCSAADVMAGSNKSQFIACDPAVGTCLTDTIKSFGRKAFRRPLTPAEVTSFERFKNVTPAGTPAEIAETILFAFLASPSFILLPELSADKEGAANKLTGFEVARR